eukprot:6644611-Pyramimonas_sp.AAC.1
MGHYYAIAPLSEQRVQKYKEMARLTAFLAALPTPTSFREYGANRGALLRLPEKCRDLWYFRSFTETERLASVGDLHLSVGPDVTLD